MKLFKWIGGLLLVAVMGQIIVGYVNYYKQFNQLKAQVSALEHENSNLRDEWVQWQRQNRTKPNTTLPTTSEQQLDGFMISEHLKLSLKQAIEQDKQQIKLTYQQAQQQQQSFNNLIQHLEQILQDKLSLNYQQPQQGSWWQRLWVVEKTTQPTVNTAQHQLLLKEIQLDVMILKTMNVLQQPIEFQHMMNGLERKMAQLPLPLFQQLESDIQSLKQIQRLNIPNLTSLELLGKQKEQL
ncbi:hypothetical protein [Moraxella sp. ZY210820]|uniref:hypothetical protein n=1 Tax=unclassified Moraxella TaxID=2685852 RepID=UPI002731051C|nr:hypothetical protein [Moraxella sp. ZY210820]WLF83648.1 hypothetical protein LU301_10390 [Moraxella sp. ZY210820]